MSVTSVRVYGTGSRGVLVENLDMSKKKVEWKAKHRPNVKVLFKVSTDSKSHEKEIENAKLLSAMDPFQKHFVYPVVSYDVGGDHTLLRYLDSKNEVSRRFFDTSAKRMFVDIIPLAGTSVAKLKASRTKLTPKQARTAISSLLQGLAALHSAGYAHGDAHEHNAVIRIQENGNVIARWIDFGEMEPRQNLQGDVKKFIAVIQTIVSMVDEDDENLEAIYKEVGRGAAPMSATGLSFYISQFLTTPRKRDRSVSSASASNSKSGSKSKSSSVSKPSVKRTLAFGSAT